MPTAHTGDIIWSSLVGGSVMAVWNRGGGNIFPTKKSLKITIGLYRPKSVYSNKAKIGYELSGFLEIRDILMYIIVSFLYVGLSVIPKTNLPRKFFCSPPPFQNRSYGLVGTYCRGSLVVSNLPSHTNNDAIKSCPIAVGKCFMHQPCD